MGHRKHRPIIGWREKVLLPELSDVPFVCKVDTGAASSSLDAIVLGIETTVNSVGNEEQWVRFQLPSNPDSFPNDKIHYLPLVDLRHVRSSNGIVTERCVIMTTARLLKEEWKIEITLNCRKHMGFPMLLGRKAIRSRFLVNVGRSWMAGGGPGRG